MIAELAQLLAGAASKNNLQRGQGGYDSQLSANKTEMDSGRNYGLSMQQSPALDKSPSEQTTQWKVIENTGSLADPITTKLSMESPMFKGFQKGEAAVMQPTAPAVGGFSVQPTEVDSSRQPYNNSGMVNYLNYMKYRGGY